MKLSTQSAVGRREYLAPPPSLHRRLWRPLSLGLLLAVGAVSTLPLLPSAASPEGATGRRTNTDSADKRAVALLRRAFLSQTRTAFSGEQTVLTFAEGEGTACVTREYHLDAYRWRIEYENPSSARGRIQISDGKWRQLYLSQERILFKRPVTPPPITSQNIESRIARICRYYRLTVEKTPDDINGHRTDRLDIKSVDGKRSWQRLWIDEATGLVLRRETYSSQNVQTAVSSWRDLHVYAQPDPAWLRWSPPRGIRVVAKPGKQETSELAEARAMEGSWAMVPAEIGDGFVFESARQISAKGARGLYCEYSDGLNTISLVQIDGDRTVADEEKGVTASHTTPIGPALAKVMTRGSVTILSWKLRQRGELITLIAEMTEPHLVKIARTLQ